MALQRSNLTNKYNPQEPNNYFFIFYSGSNLTNKYNPQEQRLNIMANKLGSNLTNKYNPQERYSKRQRDEKVQILPINTILKNC